MRENENGEKHDISPAHYRGWRAESDRFHYKRKRKRAYVDMAVKLKEEEPMRRPPDV